MCIWLHYTTYLCACILCACRGAVAALEALLQHSRRCCSTTQRVYLLHYTIYVYYYITLHTYIVCMCIARMSRRCCSTQGAVAALKALLQHYPTRACALQMNYFKLSI